jgi:hypothetical protein
VTLLEKFQKLLQLGAHRQISGGENDYIACVRSASSVLLELVEGGYQDLALRLEPAWYNTLVKQTETDQHYYESFKGHAGAFWNVGKEYGGSLEDYNSNPQRLAFVIHSGVLLGHTEVMLRVIAAWKTLNPSLEIFLISLKGMEPKLRQRLVHLRIPYAVAPESLPPSKIAQWSRKLISVHQIHTAIWLSTPCWVSYFFGYGLAKKQVLWSLKFHAVHLGNSVTHIAMTRPTDHKRVRIHGNEWYTFSPPLSVPVNKTPINTPALRKLEWRNRLLFGTLAREEKFNSPRFLDAVLAIIKKCPTSHYLYTGRMPPAGLVNALEKHGVASQSSYIGWVDTNDFAQMLDVFLESFPFGCGVTGAQALAHGTKVISLWDEDTLPRFYFSDVTEAKTASNYWLIAETVEEYINFGTQTYEEFKSAGLNKNPEFNVLEELDQHKFKALLDIIFYERASEPS